MAWFFFQAEDGIRVRTVTGVQTCALPISQGGTQADVKREDLGIKLDVTPSISPDGFVRLDLTPEIQTLDAKTTQITADFSEIGRASCREGAECSVRG